MYRVKNTVKRLNRWHLQPGLCQTSMMKTIWEPGQIFQTCPATVGGEYYDPMWLSVILHTLQARMHTTYTCSCIHTHTRAHTHTHTHTHMNVQFPWTKMWILEMICVGWLYLSKTVFFFCFLLLFVFVIVSVIKSDCLKWSPNGNAHYVTFWAVKTSGICSSANAKSWNKTSPGNGTICIRVFFKTWANSYFLRRSN